MKTGFFGGKFLPLHMGHVYTLTKAACMVDELYVVLSYSENRDKQLCEEGKIPYVPYTVRLQWLSTLTKDMPNVKVFAIADEAFDDETYDWHKGAADIRKVINKPIDAVFSSETGYEDIFKELYPEATHIIVDSKRTHFPISGTLIRKHGVYKYWDFIPQVARPFFVKKVALIGTESCGKSTLTRYLATVFQTNFVEEYGRTVCEDLGGCDGIITEEHFKEIVYGHKFIEYQKAKEANKVLFIDSEAVVTQYYSLLYLGKEYPWIEGAIHAQNYDLYLFLEPDVKWVDDGLRTYGDEEVRNKNNQLLKEMFDEYHIPYITVKGDYYDRFVKAEEEIEKLLV